MRPRSVTGPLVLLSIGVFFLLNNIRPDLVSLSRIGDYWPFLVIGAGVIGLVEVLFHASRGVAAPPRPVAGAGIFWILIFGIFVITVSRHQNFRIGRFDSPGISVFGSDYDYDVSLSESSRGVTRIVLDNVRGNLSVKGEDLGDIKVTGRKTVRAFNRTDADRADQQSRVRPDRQGDVLFIRAEDFSGPHMMQISTDLDITVPRGVSIESRGRSGDLAIDSIDGPVDISAGRGDIRLNHIAKDVKIEATRGGEIHVTDIKGSVDLQGRGNELQIEEIAGPVTINGDYGGTLEFHALAKPLHFNSSRTQFQLEAIPGTVTMDLGNLKVDNAAGPVRFRTGVRDIDATDVAEALDLNVDRGDIHVTVNKMPVPKIDIHTRNGDISLTLPEKAEFQLDGTTAQGEIDNEFGGGLHNESNGRTSTIRGRVGNGPSVNVGTDRGSISIRKIS